MSESKEGEEKPVEPTDYVAPEIETVVSAQNLEREVQYAGITSQKAAG